MKKLCLLITLCFVAFAVRAIDIPRAEYPRPQFQRTDWQNLNGNWTFTFDFGKSGKDRKLYESTGFDRTIIVPFCPESELSGVAHKDFINAMWYHRNINIPADWSNKNVLLHFGAVDYVATIYVDGKRAAIHWGGSSSFTVDITPYVKAGNQHNLIVYVEDDQRSGNQARGKQSPVYHSQGCEYTRTTGIWQTVWMESVAKNGLQSAYIIPELDQSRFIVYPKFYALQSGLKLRINIKDGSKVVTTQTIVAATPSYAVLPIENVKTWSPESPFLYDFEFEVLDAQNKVIDRVTSYAGMRKIHIEGNKFYLNNQPRFLRFVLDQGFYPTGVWTAPSDADLKKDIEISMAAGFNGARLHQKVFEERFHYWADRLGYLTWGESANWGANANNIETARNFITEWEEVVVRDRNHPSIIAWTPFNETWERPDDNERAIQHDRFIRDIYNLSHNLDYRPINDASGNFHVITDLWTAHHYEQSVEELDKYMKPNSDGSIPQRFAKKEVRYSGQPFFIDEYGGVKWVEGKEFSSISWGYGDAPKTKEEAYQRIEKLTDLILSYDYISGYCYTQLTDVEQEQNGIYNYDRTPKFDVARIRTIFSKNPAPKK